MSYQNLHSLLQSIFVEVNQTNAVPSAQDLWSRYSHLISPLAQEQDLRHEFVELGNGIIMPKSVEALRTLSLIRQRFSRDRSDNGEDRLLVGQVRGESYLRQRPIQDLDRTTLSNEAQAVAALTSTSFHFSEYQVQGWERVKQAIASGGSLVTIAPTGSGKTEVFLLPIIHEIANSLHTSVPKRFVLLYPRTALLKDQLRRIFEYVSRANVPSSSPLIVGLQFTGIGANASDTINNRQLFDGQNFKLIDTCPICSGLDEPESRLRLIGSANANVHRIQCDNCGAVLHLSLSKRNHGSNKPHLMVTTAESLDRFYLQPEPAFEDYLKSLTGIVVDEVHLYQSLYGAHVHNILKRIEQMRGNTPFTKIASSATISEPQKFISRLFGISRSSNVILHDADNFPKKPAGVEAIFFLQAPEEQNRKGAISTLIQSAMAMGHGVLDRNERALIFTDSLDMVGSVHAKIRDAEVNKGLWRWRTEVGQTNNAIRFHNMPCPRTMPILCNDIYAQGECWRVINGGVSCFAPTPNLRSNPLDLVRVSSGERADYREGDMVVATSALEVGVDDPTIRSTIHYRPPIGGVFSFIQRRGRAGRKHNQVAYTLMVLGNTASDQFYFFRRHRLLNTHFELPLNSNNRTVTEIHERLARERKKIGDCVRGSNIPVGTWQWVKDTLSQCALIKRRFGADLLSLSNSIPTTGRRWLRNWINREKSLLETYLSIDLILDEIEQDCPASLLEIARQTKVEIDAYLSSPPGSSYTAARNALTALGIELVFLQNDPDQEISQPAERMALKLQEFRSVIKFRQLNYSTRHAESAYFFFVTLERLLEEDWILYSPIETMRIVLQALFYLHIGVEESEEGQCQARMEHFVPDSYFQEVKPIAIEVLDFPSSNTPPRLAQGQVTELSTLLIPYKPIYRFHNEDQRDNNLSLLDTSYVGRSPGGRTITIESGAKGLLHGNVLNPQKITVRPVETNPEGQQVVKICPVCCRVYNYTRNRQCHNQDLLLVKLFADPLIGRDYVIHKPEERITRTLSFLQDIEGATTVYGSHVQAKTVVKKPSDYVVIPNNALEFDACYDIPLRYSLRTRGIAWNLSGVVTALLENGALKRGVESVIIDQTPKTFGPDIILHTAAHILHKTIASIGGVNEQVLEYAFNTERCEVAVWERTEGGTGISDIVQESIRANTQLFYKELLLAILCPVNLAERTAAWTTPDQLRDILNNQYGLSQTDPLVNQVVIEALGERQTQTLDPAMRFVCEQYDGCPACVQTTYCTAHSNQSLEVSRMVGEAIMRQLVRHLSREQAEEAMQHSIENSITPPYTMGGNLEQGIYDVLLL